MICLVTDRRRLLAVGRADADGPDPWRACLAVQVRHAVAAGVDLIHLRERDLEAGALASLVTQLLAITAGSSTRLVVSDRVDIALACGADGVHLRGDSIPAAAARRLAPDGFLVGRSVHSRSEALAAADADYLIAGTVFASPSKPGLVTLLGTNGLRAITRAVRSRAWRSFARASITALARAISASRFSRRASSSGIDIPSGTSA